MRRQAVRCSHHQRAPQHKNDAHNCDCQSGEQITHRRIDRARPRPQRLHPARRTAGCWLASTTARPAVSSKLCSLRKHSRANSVSVKMTINFTSEFACAILISGSASLRVTVVTSPSPIRRPQPQEDLERHWMLPIGRIQHRRLRIKRHIRPQPKMPRPVHAPVPLAAKRVGANAVQQDAPAPVETVHPCRPVPAA